MLPEALKINETTTNKGENKENKEKFSASGTYQQPDHLTFEEKEILEAKDRKILAAK